MSWTPKQKQQWIEAQPLHIREMIKKYPPDATYIIRSGAPYGVSCEGTIVTLHGYDDNGSVSIIVRPENKLPEAIKHEDILCDKFKKTPEEREKIHKSSTLVLIDPKWLQQVIKE